MGVIVRYREPIARTDLLVPKRTGLAARTLAIRAARRNAVPTEDALGPGVRRYPPRGEVQVLDVELRQEIVGIIEEADIDRKLRLAMRLIGDTESAGFVSHSVAEAAGDPVQDTDDAENRPSGRSMFPPTTLGSRSETLVCAIRPGRPASWSVLDPAALSDRPRLGSPRGRYLLVHSVAHIELCAVELALAAVLDFPREPLEYHRAMLGIAKEEIIHTRMLLRRLEELGGSLGTDPVHLALWDTAQRFQDLPGRLGVVPRILEARGLDVSARLREGLLQAGDAPTAEILERIYQDEIGHVRVGTDWFRVACAERGMDPEEHFVNLMETFRARRGGVGPIDREGRRQAGFTERELQALEGRPGAERDA